MNDFTNDPDYYAEVGVDLFTQGQLEDAIRAFEQALRLNRMSVYLTPI